MIQIAVQSTRAVIRSQEPLTVGLRGAKVRFSFGETWANLTKTAVFRQGQKAVAVTDVGDKAEIPWEVLTLPGVPVLIGIYGIDSTGEIAVPTVWAKTKPVLPGADPEADPSAEPTPGLWEQLQGKLGSLEQLNTADKTSLVAAINEAAANVPVTSVNGQTGDVTVPAAVKITVTDNGDGTCNAEGWTAPKILEVYNQGSPVYCQYGNRILPLLFASKPLCTFSCLYNGNIYTVTVSASGVNAASAPLASGNPGDTPREAVLYTPQDLTEDQKTQACENIGAVPAPFDASVGQTVVVREVDESGKPTKWEAADLPADSQFELLADITTTEVVSAIETTVDGAYREFYVVITTAADENVGKWMDLQVNGVRVSEGTPNRNVLKNNVMYVRTWPEINGVYCISSFMNGGSSMGGDAMHSFRNGISYSDKISLRTSTYANPGTTGNIFASGSGMKVWGRK